MHSQRFFTDRCQVILHNEATARLWYSLVKRAYDTAPGTDAEKRLAGREYIRAELSVQLGEENFARVFKEVDFDPATGIPVWLIVAG